MSDETLNIVYSTGQVIIPVFFCFLPRKNLSSLFNMSDYNFIKGVV